jgi:ABC-2 type transport system permease protein
MRTILYFIQKEFRQLKRNRIMLPILFVVPLVQMLILVYAATFDMKKIDLAVVDKDLSSTSRELTAKFDAIPFYNIERALFDEKQGEELLLKGEADAILIIPQNMERNLVREDKAGVQLMISAIDGNSAQLTYAYSSNIIMDFNKKIISEWKGIPEFNPPARVKISELYMFNELLNYKWFMAPGILSILVTVIGMFLSGMNLVREKEMGTIEQLNVTPVKKYQFIVGKLMPFWIIALLELCFGLTLAWLIFDLPFRGNLLVLLVFAGVYLISVLSLGLLISTVSNNQQQVMFVSFFFMIVFILMGGIFTPTESMPQWAQVADKLNPVYYFMRIMRNIVLKGSGFFDLFEEFISLTILGTLFLGLAVWRYKKTT